MSSVTIGRQHENQWVWFWRPIDGSGSISGPHTAVKPYTSSALGFCSTDNVRSDKRETYIHGVACSWNKHDKQCRLLPPSKYLLKTPQYLASPTILIPPLSAPCRRGPRGRTRPQPGVSTVWHFGKCGRCFGVNYKWKRSLSSHIDVQSLNISSNTYYE